MKLAIFGGTGRTGVHLVQQALAAGHEVTALARTPSKFTIQHEKLKVVQGDVENLEAVRQTVAGTDAVLSAIGPHDQGMKNIITAMKEAGVRRLIMASGAGVPQPGDEPTFINNLISGLIKTFSRKVYDEAVAFVGTAANSGLDWTVIRAPRLVDSPAKGTFYVGKLGKGMGMALTRADLADFMLRQLDDPTWVGKAPVVTNQ
jgi:putative NADH-flavin reductase